MLSDNRGGWLPHSFARRVDALASRVQPGVRGFGNLGIAGPEGWARRAASCRRRLAHFVAQGGSHWDSGGGVETVWPVKLSVPKRDLGSAGSLGEEDDGVRGGDAVTPGVVRVVVNGWTWVRGEARNTTRAKRMLLEALEADGWPQERADVTITPGGFIRAPFPRVYDRDGGARGWGSDEDFTRLIPTALREVERVIGTDRMMARIRQRTRLLTLGVDLNNTTLKSGPETHAEMVAVIDTETGAVIHWTGKSYPVDAVQARTLVHAPLASHLFKFDGTPMLILGCHDLNLFSERARANQLAGSDRRMRCDEMRRLAKELNPISVLQHPHTTDTPKIWSTAWAGVRRSLPTAKTLASAIAYCDGDKEGVPRAPLDTVMERTAWGDVVDVVVEGH